jgi:hypothetical protein
LSSTTFRYGPAATLIVCPPIVSLTGCVPVLISNRTLIGGVVAPGA